MAHKKKKSPGCAVAAVACAVLGACFVAPLRVARADDTEPRADDTEPRADDTEPAPAETPTTPPAMTPEAKVHYDRGLQLYGAHLYPAAIAALEQGFALDPRPEFLFAEAQAFRLSNDCARAIPLYQRFLHSNPSSLQIQATQLALDRCGPARASTATAPATAGAPVQPPPPSASEPSAARDAAARPHWWHDPLTVSALGAGVAALGVGVGFAAASDQARDDARSAKTTTYAAFDSLWATAERRRAIAVTSFIVGGALLAAGTVRIVLLRQHDDADTKRRLSAATAETGLYGRVCLAAGPGGAALLWEGGY